MKFPKTIGAAADLLYTLQQQRLEKSKEVEVIKEQETALETHILENMLPAAQIDGARGTVGQVTKKKVEYAEITDWDAYFGFMAKKKSWALVQKRASITALREIWDAGKSVPGAERKEKTVLHVSKVGAK